MLDKANVKIYQSGVEKARRGMNHGFGINQSQFLARMIRVVRRKWKVQTKEWEREWRPVQRGLRTPAREMGKGPTPAGAHEGDKTTGAGRHLDALAGSIGPD